MSGAPDAAPGKSWAEPRGVPVPSSLAPPGDDEVHVWWAPVIEGVGGLADDDHQRLLADLDDQTRARLDRMRRPADRLRGLVAHGLLRRLLGAILGVSPRDVRLEARCVSCGSTDHGKRRLAGKPPVSLEFNLTHAGEVAAVALAARAPVGIDVEALRPVDWPALRRNVFSDDEWSATQSAGDPHRACFQAWARKEAAVKVTGHGLSLPLSAVCPQEGDDGWVARLPRDAGTVMGHDLDTLTAHVGAVATHREDGPPAVTVHRADLAS